MILQRERVELATPTGPMQSSVYGPVAPGRYPGLVLFSEIFQETGPIRRTAAMFAGHGFLVIVPEIFHELEPAGAVIPYDDAGAARGNRHKIGKSTKAYDDDARACLAWLASSPRCTGKLGALGVCIGGHLAFRCAMNREVSATVSFYATDIHKRSLGAGGDDSLDRAGEIEGELMMVWGRQDPHVPADGRALVYQTLAARDVHFTWHEVNGAHAFLRDEGHRYDPALALACQRMAIDLFQRKLGEGDRLHSRKPMAPDTFESGSG